MRKHLARAGRSWTRLKALLLGLWQLLGRMGLAWRRLLTLALWPLWLLATPLRWYVRWIWPDVKVVVGAVWEFIGLSGLALRNLFTWFVWSPLAHFAHRFARLYRATVHRFVLWLGGWLAWPLRKLWAFLVARWTAAAPWRALYRRRWRSRWTVLAARLRLALKRPSPPATAVILPRTLPAGPIKARTFRLATAVISIGITLGLSFISLQEQQPDRAVAGGFSRTIIITSTPGPTTPTPELLEPTATIQLTPWPTPDPLNEGGTLAFAMRQNGNNDIYLLPIGQAEPVRLTYHPADDREPIWSPDGRELAFTSHRDGNWEIYIFNLPAGQLRRLTHDLAYDGRPSWSPDGQWIVYESYQNSNLDIYIVKADLSEGPYRITKNPALDFAPAWAPSGRHIAYTSWRSGNKDIFLMSLDEVSDETAVNVTNSPAQQEDHPAFSPDGRFLAYDDTSAGFPLIYALPLTENYGLAGPAVGLGQQGRYPAWSPDSGSLVYVHEQGERRFLLAASPNAWGVSPQAYATTNPLGSASWTAVTLAPDWLANLNRVDPPVDEAPLFVEALATPEPTDDDRPRPPVLLWQVPVNAPSPYLNDRVDQSFLALRDRVIAEAGWDFLGQLDNMFEALNSKPPPGLSNRSWNKAGRAFDLPYHEALAFEPRIEVVREDLNTGTYWRVYVKAAVQDGSQGEPLLSLPWDFRARFGNEPLYYDQGGKLKEAIPPGYYVDFTALAADYGWTWVPATDNWRTYFPGTLFWHYENQQGLTWDEAMQEIYNVDEIIQVFGE